MAEYLGCYLDPNLNGESMASISCKKINTILQLPCRENKFLNPELRRLNSRILIIPAQMTPFNKP